MDRLKIAIRIMLILPVIIKGIKEIIKEVKTKDEKQAENQDKVINKGLYY